MAFGAMAGGMVTLVGTSPNILVAEVRQDIVGQPFQMFDYAPVGLALTAAALVFRPIGVEYRVDDRLIRAPVGCAGAAPLAPLVACSSDM